MNDLIFRAHTVIFDEHSISLLFKELWALFSILHGNPDYGYSGVRFALGISFTFLLVAIVKMRALHSWEPRHFVALAGSCIMFIRFLVMLVFIWGYEIGLYQNQVLRYLFPPLEHVFETLALLCFGYYSIISTKPEHNPPTRRFLLTIPIVLTFYVHCFGAWHVYFFSHYPQKIVSFLSCSVEWESHAVMSILSISTLVMVIKNVGFKYPILTYFWSVVIAEQLLSTISSFAKYEPSWLLTILYALNIWSVPLLMLHFAYGYSIRANINFFCGTAQHNSKG